jgi:hypothetical protein
MVRSNVHSLDGIAICARPMAQVRVPLYIASIQNFLKYTVLDVEYGLQKATWKKSLQNHEQKSSNLQTRANVLIDNAF